MLVTEYLRLLSGINLSMLTSNDLKRLPVEYCGFLTIIPLLNHRSNQNHEFMPSSTLKTTPDVSSPVYLSMLISEAFVEVAYLIQIYLAFFLTQVEVLFGGQRRMSHLMTYILLSLLLIYSGLY